MKTFLAMKVRPLILNLQKETFKKKQKEEAFCLEFGRLD
jgi:hypothetical protein